MRVAGATIRIFLADGTPLGIRVLEKSNWTGRGFDFARKDWLRARVREDFARPGVYVLYGVDDDGSQRLYVGEADELRTRLNQHFSGPGSKDFWTRAVVFTSKDENLNKAHVRYLEARLVGLAQASKRSKLENGNAPALPSLSEYDRAEADAFLDEMLVIYPLLAIDAFTVAEATVAAEVTLFAKGARGALAQGRDSSEGFVVLQASRATMTEVGSLVTYVREERAKLIASGVLVDGGDLYVFTQDYTFTSPTTAAAVVLGRPSNGRTEWKDATGKTLKEIQAAAESV